MVDLHLKEQKIASLRGRLARITSKLPPTYGTLDLGRLYDELPAGTAALRAFCAEVAALK